MSLHGRRHGGWILQGRVDRAKAEGADLRLSRRDRFQREVNCGVTDKLQITDHLICCGKQREPQS